MAVLHRGNTVAQELGYGVLPTGSLNVWLYARVDPKRGRGAEETYSSEECVYFLRVNKLPRRINVSSRGAHVEPHIDNGGPQIPLYVHGFTVDAGHKLQTLHALLHHEYVMGMDLPPDLYSTIHRLLAILLAAWSEYPNYAADSVQDMREELVNWVTGGRSDGDDAQVLQSIVSKAAKGWTGYSKVSTAAVVISSTALMCTAGSTGVSPSKRGGDSQRCPRVHQGTGDRRQRCPSGCPH